LNLEHYMALHVKTTEVKVAYTTYKEQARHFEYLLGELLERSDKPVTGEELREALLVMHRAHQAYTDALAAVIFHDKA